MSKNQNMMGSIVGHSPGLVFLTVLLSCSPINYSANAEPERLPSDFIYLDRYADDPQSFILLQRLKQIVEHEQEVIGQARELDEERMAIEVMLKASAQRSHERELSLEDTEMLPIPSAIVHHGPANSGKQTSYVNLCHFKICNMGRKRHFTKTK